MKDIQKLLGAIYLNNSRFWWKVRLPGTKKISQAQGRDEQNSKTKEGTIMIKVIFIPVMIAGLAGLAVTSETQVQKKTLEQRVAYLDWQIDSLSARVKRLEQTNLSNKNIENTKVYDGFGQSNKININGRFTCKNILLKRDYDNSSEIIGEITNNSGHEFGLATFQVSFYDYSGRLIETSSFMVGSFLSGQTRSFDASVELPVASINTYKIDFEGGL